MSISTPQLRQYVIQPSLQHIGLHSQAAENLVLGTALVESAGEYLKQLGGGPALGLFQMEPATLQDIRVNFLAYKTPLRRKVESLMTKLPADDDEEIIGNLYYATAMCRCHYRRVRESLPHAGDAEGMASYWKRYYNTYKGAGTVEKALPSFRIACGLE